MKLKILLLFIFLSLTVQLKPINAANSLDVVINEIAWMGTEISYNDEWIELYNNSNSPINLEGWILKAEDGSPETILEGIMPGYGFHLLERTDDTSVPSVIADQIYTGALKNGGEFLKLFDSQNNLIDQINASSQWFAGDNSTKQTMERLETNLSGSDSSNWATSQTVGGTPKVKNSVTLQPEPAPTPPPAPPEPTPEATPPEQPPLTPQPQLEPSPEPETPTEQQEEKDTIHIPSFDKSSADKSEDTAKETKTIYPSGIIINEILPSPEGSDAEKEWIEVFNQNNFDVNLADWKVSDIKGTVKTYVFPKNTIIKSKNFLLLLRPDTKITLNNDADGVKLIRPDEITVSITNYEKAPQGQSYNLKNSQWFWSATLTPEKTNIIAIPSTNKAQKQVSIKAEPEKKDTRQKLAAIGPQETLVSIKFLDIALIAVIIATSSGILMLLLKKLIKRREIDF